MITLNKIIDTNPLSEFNKYLYINSINKNGQVFVFRFPKNGGALVEFKKFRSPFKDPYYAFEEPYYTIYPLIFDKDTFDKVLFEKFRCFTTDSYSECRYLINKMIEFDKCKK